MKSSFAAAILLAFLKIVTKVMGQILSGLCCGLFTSENSTDSNAKLHQPIAYLPAVVDSASERRFFDELQNPQLKAFHDKASLNFASKYTLTKKLGEGAFATVHECVDHQTDKTFAVKITTRVSLTSDALRCALMEPMLLKSIYHSNVMRYHAFYKDERYYYMICEELKGGALMDILEKHQEKYTEKEICRLVRMLLEALAYIHARNIVHRDLKLENLMLDLVDGKNPRLKIVDFGFAVKLAKGESLNQVLGTPGFMAPEVIQGGPYGKPVDIWSAGVIVYTLLCGYPPFHHDYVSDLTRLFRIICSGYYVFDSPYWDGISTEAKDIIHQMLVVDPNNRPTAADLLKHEWFKQAPISPRANVNMLNVLSNLQRFNRIMKKKAAKATQTIAHRRSLESNDTSEEIHDMISKKLDNFERINFKTLENMTINLDNYHQLSERNICPTLERVNSV